MAEFDYKKLLEKAQKEYKQCSTDAERRRLESIFPELAENEDEKIRKELHAFLKKATLGDLDMKLPYETFGKWLAWLEKQECQIQDTQKEEFIDDIITALKYLISTNESWEYLKDALIWIEKQKNHNSQSSWKPTEEQMQTIHMLMNEGAPTFPEDKRVLTALYEDLQKLLKE